VDPIEPDTRGVSSIRELMEKHRENPTCYECHRKMDPLRLAMENFDHVGAWSYTKTLPIDPRGEMPDGSAFKGADGIRDYLLEQPDQFTRCLTEKLLIYALGRRLSFTDRDDIDRIIAAMPGKDYGLRELIHETVATLSRQRATPSTSSARTASSGTRVAERLHRSGSSFRNCEFSRASLAAILVSSS